MGKKIKFNVPFFIILGAMNGVMISLVASFFLDYIVTSYTIYVTLSYINWVVLLAPCFALLGALFHVAAALFMYEDEKKKKWFQYKK